MYKHIFTALSFVSVTVAFGACSSSDKGGTNGGAGDGAASCDTIVQDPKYPNQGCNNPADRCYLQAHTADARKWGGFCATQPAPDGCIGFISDPTSADAVACYTDCLHKQLTANTGSAVSDSCALCEDAVVLCGAKFCINECAGLTPGTGPDTVGCTKCLCATHTDDAGVSGNCLQDAFAECAGFRPTDAQVGCPG